MLDFDKAVSIARTKILLQPSTTFISCILLQLTIKAEPKIKTANVDGKRIRICPEWFLKLTVAQQMFVLLHEVWHVAYGHTVASPYNSKINYRILNRAEDHVINLRLIAEGFEMFPKGLAESRFEGMTSAEVYDILIDEPYEENPDDPFEGDLVPSEDSTEGLSPIDWGQMIQTAATQAKMAGQGESIPSDVIRDLTDVLNPRLPWNTVLRQHMSAYQRKGVDYNRRNRRISKFYAPSRRSAALGEIRAYVDTSYSTSIEELSVEVAELEYLRDTLKPSKLTMHAFACTLGKEQLCTKNQETSFVPDVSGGTLLEPVWENIKAHSDTQVALIFTDGHVTIPDETVPCELIFIIVNNPSWSTDRGLTLHVEI